MAWLGGARLRAYLRILALVQVLMLVLLVLTSQDGVDRGGHLLGSDFLSFWSAGKLLVAGSSPYDAAAHIAEQRKLFAPDDGYTAFFYPPSFLVYCLPLGLVGYFTALAGWLAVTAAGYLLSLRAWLRECAVPLSLTVGFLAFPAVSIVITHGQTAFLVAALLGGAMLSVGRSPVLAGVLLGLATIKPQFGLLVPVALVACREWRSIGWAVLVTLALGLLSAALFGPASWMNWLAASGQAQDALASGAVGHAKMVSAFAALALLGIPVSAAMVVQGLVTVALCVLVWIAARDRAADKGLGALVLAGAPLATPFVLDYDLVLLAFPMIWLAGEGHRSGFRDWEKLAIALAFVAPAVGRPLAMNLGLPVTPFAVGFLFRCVFARLRAERAGTAPG